MGTQKLYLMYSLINRYGILPNYDDFRFRETWKCEKGLLIYLTISSHECI